MMLKFVKEIKGSEFVQKMEEEYGSMDNLKRLIENDPEIYLFSLDLEDWLFHLEHFEAPIKQTEVLFVKKFKIDLSDLELLDTIKKEQPQSIKDLSQIINKDMETIKPKVQRLAEGGLLKFEPGPKNAKNPW